MHKIVYYLTKFISVAGLIYGGWLLFVGFLFIYSQYSLLSPQEAKDILSQEDLQVLNSVIGYSGLVGLVGLILLISAIGLFFFKKWGFYLFLISIILIWLLSWARIDGISKDWISLLLASIIFIYLAVQRKLILGKSLDRNGNIGAVNHQSND